MGKAKDEIKKMLDTLPDDSTFEDIQYHIFVREKLEWSLEDVRSGRLLSQEEVENKMTRWLGK